MDAARLVVAVVAALPAAWFALVLADRVPDSRPLATPRPAFPLPRGLSLTDVSVYPVTGGLFVLAAGRFDGLGVLVAHLGFFTVLVALSVIDLETLRLPDRLVLPSTGAALVALTVSALVVGSVDPIVGGLFGAFVYFGVLLVAHLVYPAGMGFGDVKLAFLMGLFLGWPATDAVDAIGLVVWAMLIGFGLGSITGVLILLVRGRSAPYPFGPFLALGTVVAVLAGPDLLPAGRALLF